MKKPIHQLWGLVFSLIPISLLLATQFRGVDFGQHWDEPTHFQTVQRAVRTGIFLPGWYNYPSIPYWIFVGASFPEFIHSYNKAKPAFKKFQDINYQYCLNIGKQNVDEWAKWVNERFGSPAHHLRVRKVFICITALAVLWVSITTIMMGYNWKEGFFAACLLAFSWEVAYHGRWIAPDAVMMQFVALTIMCCVLLLVGSAKLKPAALWGAALFAAFATGTKYTAGLILIPVFISAYIVTGRQGKPFITALILLKISAIFAVAYVLTTPATILEPLLFWKFILENVDLGYSDGWFGHTVPAGWAHLGMNAQWLGLCLLSKYKVISLTLFMMAFVGAYSFWRRSRDLFIVLIAYPLIYVLFMSTKWAMIVRNLLVIAPFIAIFSARGVFYIYEKIQYRWLRFGWLLIFITMLIVDGLWLVKAAETIAYRGTDQYVRELASYIDGRPLSQFWVSPVLRHQLEKMDGRIRMNLAEQMTNAQYVCAYHREYFENIAWFPANDPFMSVTCFGPMEVNMNYYPDWGGDNHILVIHMAKYSALVNREKKLREIMRTHRLITGRSIEGI